MGNTINVQCCYIDADEPYVLPKKASGDAAGFDIYSNEEVTIDPGETVKIHTGIAMAIPKGYFGGIYARSGTAVKRGLRPANCVGVIDADYRGEIIVALHNDSSYTQKVEQFERIAQIIIQPCPEVSLELVDELDMTERGAGGFGSTGVGVEVEFVNDEYNEKSKMDIKAMVSVEDMYEALATALSALNKRTTLELHTDK